MWSYLDSVNQSPLKEHVSTVVYDRAIHFISSGSIREAAFENSRHRPSSRYTLMGQSRHVRSIRELVAVRVLPMVVVKPEEAGKLIE